MGAQRAIMLSPLTEFMNTTCRAKTGWTCASVDENLDEQMMGMLSYGGKVTLDRVDEHNLSAETGWTRASVDETTDEEKMGQLS